MARKLSKKLIARLLTGDYAPLLREIKQDPELSLEVRVGGEAKVYYRKGCILTLSAKTHKTLAPKYIKDGRPVQTLDLQDPKTYLAEAKKLVWEHSDKKEFATQQKIAMGNRSELSDYIFVDMEYQLPLDKLDKKTRIDLVGIERATGDIVLFELKQGMTALDGSSGVMAHAAKMEQHIASDDFCRILREDVAAIIADKKELGIITTEEPELSGRVRSKFIFAYKNEKEKAAFERRFSAILISQ